MITPKVKYITNFFQPAQGQKSSSKGSLKVLGSQKCKQLFNRKSSRNYLKGATHGKTAHDKSSRGSVISNQNINTNKNKDGDSANNSWIEESTSESENEGYFTPINESNSVDQFNRVDSAFLWNLASMLQTTEKSCDTSENQSETVNNSQIDQDQSNMMNEDVSGLGIKDRPDVESLSVNSQDEAEREVEMNDDTNPESMSVSTVLEMFNKIRSDMKDELERFRTQDIAIIKKDIQSLKNTQKLELKKQVKEQVDEYMKIEANTFKQMQTEMAYWKIKSENLVSICGRMSMEISDLTSRIENLEVNSSKTMIMINGLILISEQNKKQDCAYELEDFFEQSLDLKVGVDNCFTLNTTSIPKPIVVKLQSMEDKRLIMAAKSKLKDVEGSLGKKIYINDYVPPFTQEKRRREQEIIRKAQPTDPQEEFDVKYTKEGLSIQGQVYSKLIKPPTPQELANISMDEYHRIFKMQLRKSTDVHMDKSTFTGYTAKVTKIDEIKNLYKRVRMLHPSARHVVCAYQIPHEHSFFGMDYQDDGEPGAGRAILELLSTNKISNRVVFIARKYGGIKMGAMRFQCYVQAAKNALEAEYPDIKIEQKVSNQQKATYQPKQSYQQDSMIDPSHPPMPKLQAELDKTRKKFEQLGAYPHSSRGMPSVRAAKPSTQAGRGYYNKPRNVRQQRGYVKGSRNFFPRRGGYTNARPGSAIIEPIDNTGRMDYDFAPPRDVQQSAW